MATTTGSTGTTAPLTGTQSTLSNWAGDYVTDMLGKGQAMANSPYQAFSGPLTAGASPLQQQAFGGIGSLQVPAGMLQAASGAGTMANQFAAQGQYQAPAAYTPNTFGSTYQAPAAYNPATFNAGFNYNPQGVTTELGPVKSVEGYMSQYQQGVSDVEAREARRQAEITRMNDASRLTKAGAYGGSRQAIMESELNRNLGTQLGDIQTKGLQSAYDRAQAQRLAESGLSMQAQNSSDAQRQFLASNAANYGMQAQQGTEASRQFGASQGLTAAGLRAQYEQQAQQDTEASRQYGAGLATRASEFGANFGADALRNQLAAYQAQGALSEAGLGAARDIYADQLQAGATARGIESEGIAADMAQFEQERDYPYKMLQFQHGLLSGLPIDATANQYAQTSALLDALSAGSLIYNQTK